jgi:hypothetical protein
MGDCPIPAGLRTRGDTMYADTIHELESRISDGIDVRLPWCERPN